MSIKEMMRKREVIKPRVTNNKLVYKVNLEFLQSNILGRSFHFLNFQLLFPP